MKKSKKVLLLLIMTLCVGLSIYFVSEKTNSSQVMSVKENDKKIILIDPGHGGMDGGASSKDGVNEKNINLNIAIKLKELLQAKGYNVVLTRDKDVGLYTEGKTIRQKKLEDLSNRVKMKEDSKCNVFVSIHLNTYPQESCKGAQVWYSNYESSESLANLIQDNLKADLDPSNHRKAKAAGNQYKVLRVNDTMAGVIVECGFLSNTEEARKLQQEEYQKKIAESLCKSISEFCNSNGQ